MPCTFKVVEDPLSGDGVGNRPGQVLWRYAVFYDVVLGTERYRFLSEMGVVQSADDDDRSTRRRYLRSF